ncbi:hypothetical protein B4U37_05950 [Sutcliffiella horikoshii]|uniref:DUF3784 domain-containing protein n=1 Tax=Sutcliffiella horikoshii TaxID=79883 RepID=A0A1Y0CKY8_9BACI|nr:DUF3784 domain-containing protein [Sutcliffiella horikoshii]ART75597.1 hypothetical protein B4U37_05950 [Sutcliffiella horikoshii]TYS73873.1 DUF3784 domain-containing protein [Sutcliffiella horikoshii]
MLLLFFIQLTVVLIFLLIGWAIVKKEAYGLISSFRSRPKEEQEELIQNGYPQKTGKLLIGTAIVLLIMLPLLFTSFPYAMEVQIGVMVVLLLGGFIYLSKYEVPKKRKKSYIISTSIAVVTFGFLFVVSYLGFQEAELTLRENSFEISGVYGDEWRFEDITQVDLVEEMPEVYLRTNGYGMQSISKGHFKVKDYGSSLLFIYKGNSPYLLIKTNDDTIFINSKDAEKTKDWYYQLVEQSGEAE